ncbi:MULTISPECIES: ATP-binding response regulator [Rhodonellum]|nr:MULTISPECIES: response regulator [Rhodonellum]
MMNSKVLIIEDDIDLLSNFKEILEYNKMNVWTALNGREALEILEDIDFDVIISDISMPQLDGLSFLSTIKLRVGLENTPLILISGKISKEEQRFGIEQGADDYLVKPVSANTLWNAVYSSLEKKKKREVWAKYRLDLALKEDRKITFHEFRTPLAGVLSIFELMETMLEDLDKAELLELIQVGRQSANRINKSLNKLSVYNRLDTLTLAPSNFVFDLELFQKIAKDHYDKLTVIGWDFVNPISFDLKFFNYIIFEFIENALKFARLGSSIEVLYEGEVFSVSNQQDVFCEKGFYDPAPFSQISRAFIEQQGLGLGLYICKRIAHIQGVFFACEIEEDLRFKVTVDFRKA